jgi:hypothetical protein
MECHAAANDRREGIVCEDDIPADAISLVPRMTTSGNGALRFMIEPRLCDQISKSRANSCRARKTEMNQNDSDFHSGRMAATVVCCAVLSRI